MNLTLGDIASLPLPCALVQDDDVLATTPEWRGVVAGTVSYPVRSTRLLVAPDQDTPEPGILPLLLAALDDAASHAGDAALEIGMVAASLRVVAGSIPAGRGTNRDVLRRATAGIVRRTGMEVRCRATPEAPCPMPDVAALVLVQLAANAERHDGAAAIDLSAEGTTFQVSWQGEPLPVRTSRRRADRSRWGLGFARIAADCLGATLHPPVRRGDHAVAALEVGVPRLALPLARLRGAAVVSATRAWDEETALPPGRSIHESARLADLAALARASPGRIAAAGGWTGRAAGDPVWVAVPPAGTRERALDVLSGLQHEAVLLRGAGAVDHATLRGLAILLAAALGIPAPRVPAGAWQDRMHRLFEAAGVRMPLPAFQGLGELDPDACFVLARRAGERFEVAGDQLWLVLSAAGRADPVSLAMPGGQTGRIAVG